MNGWSKKGWLASLVLALCVAGCGDKSGGASSGSAAASAKSTGSATATAKATAAATSTAAATATVAATATGTAAPSAAAEIDVKSILAGDGEDASGIAVNLADVKDDAPALGGVKPNIAADKVEWLPVGPLQVMNPGWEKKKVGELGILVSPDKKAGVVFTGFDTPENGAKKVDEMTKQLGFKETKWKKAKPVKLGEDKSIPALISFGTAKDPKGTPMKLYFALIKTGQPVNVLALGGADDDAPAEELNTALGIVALAKKK